MRRPDHRRFDVQRAYRRAPAPWKPLLFAAAIPVALYLLTHPVHAALLAGLVAGRLSTRFAPHGRRVLRHRFRLLARFVRREFAAVR
ncbi:hypothetical protein [Halospeciosus flavus]|uniref:Uncharacterized protein n=1 Tax=Halospeciosus flavus TaxID=3032283 RepID=A0ABD5Z457_9EURY|nr:hypothetical protein [Halospeciosus flavus]